MRASAGVVGRARISWKVRPWRSAPSARRGHAVAANERISAARRMMAFSGTAAVYLAPGIGLPAVFDTERFLAQLVVIVAATRLVGALAARLGQPRVVGEITAG